MLPRVWCVALLVIVGSSSVVQAGSTTFSPRSRLLPNPKAQQAILYVG